MATLIEKALQTAKPAPTPGEIESLAKELARLKELDSSLLPIEKIAKDEVAVRIQAIEQKVNYAEVAGDLSALSLLDPVVFSWTKTQVREDVRRYRPFDVPVFAYIPLSERFFQAEVLHGGIVSFRFHLPQLVHDAYVGIFQRSKKYLSWENIERVRFKYEYPGLIPDHIREVVDTETKKQHFDRLALVCEVDKWETRWSPAPPRAFLDPILIGEREGALWVLASFDPTPVEKYLLNEFTQ